MWVRNQKRNSYVECVNIYMTDCYIMGNGQILGRYISKKKCKEILKLIRKRVERYGWRNKDIEKYYQMPEEVYV